jgi:hypothetical protein
MYHNGVHQLKKVVLLSELWTNQTHSEGIAESIYLSYWHQRAGEHFISTDGEIDCLFMGDVCRIASRERNMCVKDNSEYGSDGNIKL